MCVVTRYCLAVLLVDCSTLPAHCKQSSVVQVTFTLLVAGCSQLMQSVVWDNYGCYPLCLFLKQRQHLLPFLKALVAFSKGTRTVKLCTNKVLQFVFAGAGKWP